MSRKLRRLRRGSSMLQALRAIEMDRFSFAALGLSFEGARQMRCETSDRWFRIVERRTCFCRSHGVPSFRPCLNPSLYGWEWSYGTYSQERHADGYGWSVMPVQSRLIIRMHLKLPELDRASRRSHSSWLRVSNPTRIEAKSTRTGAQKKRFAS